MPRITVDINCGATACHASTGSCHLLRSQDFGRVMWCFMFGQELRNEAGKRSGLGWLQRLPECLAAEGEKPQDEIWHKGDQL